MSKRPFSLPENDEPDDDLSGYEGDIEPEPICPRCHCDCCVCCDHDEPFERCSECSRTLHAELADAEAYERIRDLPETGRRLREMLR